jgi:hypothetical protein
MSLATRDSGGEVSSTTGCGLGDRVLSTREATSRPAASKAGLVTAGYEGKSDSESHQRRVEGSSSVMVDDLSPQ